MKFEINKDLWEIEEIKADQLKEMYEKQMEEKAYYIFGVTQKSEHKIYINKDLCEAQKIKTLKHELTHCYIWEYGLYNVMDINEEVICEIIASSNDFINEVVEQYLNIEITNIYANDKLVETIKKVGDLNARDRGYMDYNNPKDRNKK